jgi:hypothetical protein
MVFLQWRQAVAASGFSSLLAAKRFLPATVRRHRRQKSAASDGFSPVATGCRRGRISVAAGGGPSPLEMERRREAMGSSSREESKKRGRAGARPSTRIRFGVGG